jgi:hypothetical protein
MVGKNVPAERPGSNFNHNKNGFLRRMCIDRAVSKEHFMPDYTDKAYDRELEILDGKIAEKGAIAEKILADAIECPRSISTPIAQATVNRDRGTGDSDDRTSSAGHGLPRDHLHDRDFNDLERIHLVRHLVLSMASKKDRQRANKAGRRGASRVG